MRWTCIAPLLVALATSAGCRSSELQKDQDKFRQTILDSYTNQIMDNLIRASNALPIVQVDYTNITGTITDMGSVGTAPTTTTTDSTQLTFAAAKQLVSRVASRMFANTAAWSLSASRQQQLAVTGNPVIDKPEIYRAYLDFLSKPGSLEHSCDPPPPGYAHMVRQVAKEYYYVPAYYKQEFFELTLKTTVMRSEPTVAQDVYSVKVADATPVPQPAGAMPEAIVSQSHTITIKLDKPIPNDSGTVKFRVGQTPYVMQLFRQSGVKGDTNDTFRASYAQSKQGIPLSPVAVANALKAAPSVDILLLHNRPATSGTEDVLKSIFNQVQLNRLDTIRLLSTP